MPETTKRTNPSPQEILLEKGKLLHAKLLKMIAVFSTVYTIINVAMEMWSHAIVTFSIVVGSGVAWLLLKANHYYYSKVWNFFQINAAVFFIALLNGRDTYLYVFYFPLAVGTLIVFQANHRKTGWTFVVLSFIALMLIVLMDGGIIEPKSASGDGHFIERFVNVVGVFIILITEIVFLVKTNEEIQSKLLLRSDELNEANDRLRSSLYTRERMMSILAHDIRSPLNNFNAYLEQLESNDLDEVTKSKVVRLLAQQSNATSKMLDDILRWSKSQQDIIYFNPEEIELKKIEAMVEEIRDIYDIGKGEMTVVMDAPQDQKYIFNVDRNMMEAIFRNLISNALKFSDEDRKIFVSAEIKEMKCEFSVQDNGQGIPEENLKKLREGVSFTTSASGSGVGLGNQIVMDFLKKHDTKLEVTSQEGRGSRFYFKLPIHRME